MPGFSTEYDIGNRAAQHCRAQRFTTFADLSASAQEIGFVYDKKRRAELRRRYWSFAIKRSVLRSITTSTVLWTPPTYALATTYGVGEVVVDANGDWWQSTVAANVGNTPTIPATQWARYVGPDSMEPFDAAATIHYHAGELVKVSSAVYLSLIDNNADTPPTANWLSVAGTTAALVILYPIASGPRTDQTTQNVFRKPRGWLRKAPSDPKAGHFFLVGVPTGPQAEDWNFENNYIVSRSVGPIMVRFVSDFVDVPFMDDMFCEALSASIAVECAPRIVTPEDGWTIQDAIRNASSHYRREIADAGMVNGIEAGPVSSPVDDWITVRY